MHKFKVWDALNGCVTDADEILAENAFEAALLFAEEDDDGQTDGLYVYADGHAVPPGKGHPIMTLDEQGNTEMFMVGVLDYEPRYGAQRVAPSDKMYLEAIAAMRIAHEDEAAHGEYLH